MMLFIFTFFAFAFVMLAMALSVLLGRKTELTRGCGRECECLQNRKAAESAVPVKNSPAQPLRVRDFMTTSLHTVPPDTEIMSAVQQLVAANISGLLVVDDSAGLVGILTERDCIRLALQSGYFDETGGRGLRQLPLGQPKPEGRGSR